MFKNKNELIIELKAKVLELEGQLVVRDKEIEFLETRGNRYFAQIEKREEQTQELFKLAKELLLKTN